MSASTKCVVDGFIPLRLSPLGHIPKYEESVGTPRHRDFKATLAPRASCNLDPTILRALMTV